MCKRGYLVVFMRGCVVVCKSGYFSSVYEGVSSSV